MTGRVYLIGAGCGDADLITLRGLRLLQRCDTVVYDALIDSRLLDLAPDPAERICVGKRSGQHSAAQETINRILVEKALQGRTVVRLKGGDPFVFGRGGEEITELQKAGVPYTVVPGISSSIAAPELAGIPVTHRRLSRSFHVITAHTAEGGQDFSRYAALEGTLVFLMGLARLEEISAGLTEGGLPEDTPAAVISDAGTSHQTAVRDCLGSIAATALREGCKAPAVIVVGAAAALEFAPTLHLPLEGVTAAVTGTDRFTRKLRGLLEAQGAQVTRLNYLRIAEYSDTPELDSALEHIYSYSILVLTSMNGADIILRRLRDRRIDVRRLSGLRIAVIGSGTAAYLERFGLIADIVPEEYTSAALGRLLAEEIAPEQRLLIVRAEQGSSELTAALDEAGLHYDDIKIYDTVTEAGEMCRTVETDYVIFASASGVRGFTEAGFNAAAGSKALCIGHVTAQAAQGLFGTVLTAEPHTAEGIIETLIREEIK